MTGDSNEETDEDNNGRSLYPRTEWPRSKDHISKENDKTSSGVVGPRRDAPTAEENRQDDDAGDTRSRRIPDDERRADVEGQEREEENLGLCKGAMPELKDGDVELLEDEQIGLDLNEPPPEIMEYARRRLGETDEVKCQMLQELRDMIYEKGECLPHRMDDDFLIRFLRARNFSLKAAYRLIVNYYNFKEEHPNIHQQINAREVRYIGDDDVITVPPYRSQCGRRLLIYRMGNWDSQKYSIEEIFKATIIVLELGILEPRAQILGGIVIFDLKNITMSHAWTVTPQVASMMISLMVTAFPMKTHAIHILHQSWVFDAIFAVFKPLLDANMRNKIFFHGSDYGNLHKHISPKYLPKQYGGTRNELPYYKWIEMLIKDKKIVEEMSKMGYVLTEEILESFISK